MSRYSIKDLEKLSGIKAHTIRIWEQRYNIIQPQRTPTNIRYYTDEDLKRILNISLLNRSNYKISLIAKMSDDELHREVLNLNEIAPDIANQVNSLTISMIEMDEQRFEKVLSSNILKYGFENVMTDIVFPFLNKVGMMWMTGAINPAKEHFMSNMIRQKIIIAADGQTSNTPTGETYMLFCPEGEFHEIALLFINYLLRARKKKVIYLGACVPFGDLPIIYGAQIPQYIFTYVTVTPTGPKLQEFISDLSHSFPKARIIVAGPQFQQQDISLPKNVQLWNSLQDAYAHLDQK